MKSKIREIQKNKYLRLSNIFLSVLLLTVIVSACGPYQKAIKSDDMALKFDQATKMYEKGKYSKAIRLFEQMAAAYRGKIVLHVRTIVLQNQAVLPCRLPV
jgi:outer membrane protein assembly factor BamD (BamD/ComL family)